MRYFSEYINDKVYAVDELGNAIVKHVVMADESHIKLSTYKIKNLVHPEFLNDEDNHLIYKRVKITKEQFESFGKSWIFKGYKNVPEGIVEVNEEFLSGREG